MSANLARLLRDFNRRLDAALKHFGRALVLLEAAGPEQGGGDAAA